MTLRFRRLTAILLLSAIIPVQGARAHLFSNLQACKVSVITQQSAESILAEYAALTGGMPAGQRVVLRGVDFFRYVAGISTANRLLHHFDSRYQELRDAANAARGPGERPVDEATLKSQAINEVIHTTLYEAFHAANLSQSQFRFWARIAMFIGIGAFIQSHFPHSADSAKYAVNIVISTLLTAAADASIRRVTETLRAQGYEILAGQEDLPQVLQEQIVRDIALGRLRTDGILREGLSVIFNAVAAAERAIDFFFTQYSVGGDRRQLERGYARFASYLLTFGRFNPEFRHHLQFIQTTFRMTLLRVLENEGGPNRRELRAGILRHLRSEIDYLNQRESAGLEIAMFEDVLFELIPDDLTAPPRPRGRTSFSPAPHH